MDSICVKCTVKSEMYNNLQHNGVSTKSPSPEKVSSPSWHQRVN